MNASPRFEPPRARLARRFTSAALSLSALAALFWALDLAPRASSQERSPSEASKPSKSEPAKRSKIEIPKNNRENLREAPPRPGVGKAKERAARLFDAIVHDDPERAMDFLFPRDAFMVLKGVSDPGRIYDRIHRAYIEDIHILHKELADLDKAQFVRLVLSTRRGWVVPRQESNRLPYWAQRHNWIYYRVGDEERRIEVRTMIAWDDEWYITHLREFR